MGWLVILKYSLRSVSIEGSSVTGGMEGGATAPDDTLQGWHPKEKNRGWIYKEQWTNEVGQVKKVQGDTIWGGVVTPE